MRRIGEAQTRHLLGHGCAIEKGDRERRRRLSRREARRATEVGRERARGQGYEDEKECDVCWSHDDVCTHALWLRLCKAEQN